MKKPLSYLILMLTNRCNLSCRYCYLGGHRKSIFHDNGSDMSFDTIDQALELFAEHKKNCSIQISGGEPLLAPRQLEYTVGKIRRISPDAPIAMQTNATLLDDNGVDFIKAYNINLGISLDGDPGMQDICRGGAPETFNALGRLEQKKVPFSVTCVVSSVNAHLLHRVVLALAGFSMAGGIGFDLLVQKGKAKSPGVEPASPLQLEIGIKKVKQALSLVNAGRQRPMVIREKEKIKGRRYVGKKASAFCHAAHGQSLAVTPKGDLYPCSQTAFDPDFYVGSLMEKNGWESIYPSLETSRLALESYKLRNNVEDHCRSCGFKGACPGDCPSRLYYNSSGEDPLACVLYRTLAFFEPATATATATASAVGTTGK